MQVKDWDEEEEGDEAATEEEELIRVQQEIERLRQEQESIMRRHAIAQCAEARRQHINIEQTSVTPHVSKPHDYANHMFMRP
jgi:hypothetical protein